jgi:hypothetical protein
MATTSGFKEKTGKICLINLSNNFKEYFNYIEISSIKYIINVKDRNLPRKRQPLRSRTRLSSAFGAERTGPTRTAHARLIDRARILVLPQRRPLGAQKCGLPIQRRLWFWLLSGLWWRESVPSCRPIPPRASGTPARSPPIRCPRGRYKIDRSRAESRARPRHDEDDIQGEAEQGRRTLTC